MMRTWAAIVAVAISIPAAARAHAVGAECRLEASHLRVEAFFDDDTPAREARIRLLDGNGTLVAEASTDERGVAILPRPSAGKYQVTVDAEAGHRTNVRVTVPEETGNSGTPERVSQGPTREQFTRPLWLQLGLGVGALLVFALVFWLVGRRGGPAPPPGGP
jgi:hypothetical protein